MQTQPCGLRCQLLLLACNTFTFWTVPFAYLGMALFGEEEKHSGSLRLIAITLGQFVRN